MNMTASPVVSLKGATLRFGRRTVWQGVDLTVQPGEFIAVLGPNGTGKTTLLRSILGLTQLSAGTIEVQGHTPYRGDDSVGYIPQQKVLERDLPIRGRDIVRFGLDGHKFGFFRNTKVDTRRVDEVITEVGAGHYANKPIGLLSGGEQQRLRIAQSLLGRPKLLLCDEPLLSLDLKSQRTVTSLIDSYRQHVGTAVLFVTHDINPILDVVDRVLYLVDGKWAIGTPEEILTTESLTHLYGAPVDVLNVRGRIVVVGAAEPAAISHHHTSDSIGSTSR